MESFLRQDYPDKELLICNDAPGQAIHCTAPGVRVANMATRFPTLSDKIQWMVDNSDGGLLCRWDDDDISLPHRLSYSLDRLGGRLEWHPENYVWMPTGQPPQHVASPGNTHVMALWAREVLEHFPGGCYPPKLSGCEDQAFNATLAALGICRARWFIPHKEVFYIYRWGVSPHHLSGRGGGPAGLQAHWDSIGKAFAEPGVYHLNPHWRADYTRLPLEAVHKLGDPWA